MSTHLSQTGRIGSIDFLRGIAMIVMALDHVRAYFNFHAFVFSPTDLQRTTSALFATRFITHFCAPTFIFLAGTSAFFVSKRKTPKETSFFLITRGVWLIFLQVTIIQFAWNFDPALHYISSNIISTIGFCMIGLAVLIHLPYGTVALVGIGMIAAHNGLDRLSFPNESALDVIWAFAHGRKTFSLGNDYSIQFVYPIIPWLGVMALGYCLGGLYGDGISVKERRKIFLFSGVAMLSTFFFLRWSNLYGDPVMWTSHPDLNTTILSFLNLEKYPPSLLFLCITLGILLLALALLEGRNLERCRGITLFGKVALFYYVLHIYVIHIVAMGAVSWQGYPWQSMIFIGSHNDAPALLKGRYGFSLTATYGIWIGLVMCLYPICLCWNRFKIKNKLKWWVSYV